MELRDEGSGVRRAVIIAYRSEAIARAEDIQVGDEISSIMVMGKGHEYDGLDLNELLSEEFEVILFVRLPSKTDFSSAACL
jgi:hypothetical protein